MSFSRHIDVTCLGFVKRLSVEFTPEACVRKLCVAAFL
jgi:hypothetical protein